MNQEAESWGLVLDDLANALNCAHDFSGTSLLDKKVLPPSSFLSLVPIILGASFTHGRLREFQQSNGAFGGTWRFERRKIESCMSISSDKEYHARTPINGYR